MTMYGDNDENEQEAEFAAEIAEAEAALQRDEEDAAADEDDD